MYAQLLHKCKPITKKPLLLTDIERPVAEVEAVLIKVHTCGICRTDLHVVEGELDAQIHADRSVVIRPGGVLRGEVHTSHLVIDEGGGLKARVFAKSA